MFSAPYRIRIQPPAPVQNAMIMNTTGRWPGAITLVNWCSPVQRSSADTGLTDGFSTNSQSSTLDAPASAPGM